MSVDQWIALAFIAIGVAWLLAYALALTIERRNQ